MLFLLVSAVGAPLVLWSRPVHRAEARLRLGEAPPMGGISPGGSTFGMLRLGGDAFANDLELLSSRTLAENVVDDVALHVRIDAPRGWTRDSLVSALSGTRATQKAWWTVAWVGGGVRVTAADERVVSAGPPGTPLSFGGVTLVARPWREGMPRRVTVRTVPHAQAAREVGGRFEIERTRRDANVVRVRFQDTDPALAQGAVAAAVRRFVALRTAIVRRESGETVDSLRAIAAVSAQELAAAEESLAAAQQATGLVAAEAQAEAAVAQYADAAARLELTRMELAALDSALGRARGLEGAAGAWSALLSYPRFLENETLAGLLQELSVLERQRRELSRRRTAESPELRATLEQLEYLDRSLRDISSDYRNIIAQQRAALALQVAGYETQLGRMPDASLMLARRQRDARILAEVVVMTEQRLRQEQLRQALTFANVQVIDAPALRDRPVWPRRKLGLAITFALAFGTGLLGMVVLERVDERVRSSAEVRALLGVPVLATVRPGQALAPAELAALVRRGSVLEPGRSRLVLVSARADNAADQAAAALRAAATLPAPADGIPLAQPDLSILPNVGTFAAAALAAAQRVPIVLALEADTTPRHVLQHTAQLLEQAGAALAGAIVVCGPRAVPELWL